MERKTKWLILIVTAIVFLVGCANNQETQTVEENSRAVEKETSKEDKNEEETDNNKADKDVTNIELSGEVVNENGVITVKGKSNLLAGTRVEVDWLDRPFSVRNPICLLCEKDAEVDKNGNFDYEIPTELQNYGPIYVTIDVILGGLGQADEIEAVYGEHGENLEGPFVYKHEILEEEYQKIHASILVNPTEEQKVYPIETPKREETPDDYANTNVWIDTELTNDHHYFYVKGKSNLLEGTDLVASYYSSKDATLAQNWVSSKANVVSDGTFILQIPYDTITDSGYIKITSKPTNSHILKTKMKQIYGEHFEKMSGEQVIANKEDGNGNMIEVILHPKPPIVKAPEKTNLTTDGEETKIQLPDDILFDHDKSELKPDAQKTLNEVIKALETLKSDTVIHINGHTDNTGEDQYNKTLSEKRAQAVETYVRQNGKVNHINISTTGYGETKPIALNTTEEGKAKNRRVEIVINPQE
ncbi:OmpA family protein [Metabacillus malikii]|uniref:Outer membrane protein OmpA-like peptidoglycan-associated protein n=1 Tax=Metabacillus malikii TaxID=1504265 RepID=A0ABT9ZHP3_9BACI|nr:OmpA family protein [Metabacillus malikii]MDQ0231805.1 outer membrane protein OmpA-like peptidoglycan-associated protein [Metabacillus malikii]